MIVQPLQANILFFVIPAKRPGLPGRASRNPETTLIFVAVVYRIPGSRIARCAGFRDD